ncbi:hypothetical protein C7S18_08310 [Ahniella affigens]|uniref:Uncharacterized protein n=1 Tax=Ahniella affigens TaxID=2021234 RepID=A0A2P1PQR8_9GAMM|nr:hypothetical protein C7S18_08310 [Ahniella affigens]
MQVLEALERLDLDEGHEIETMRSQQLRHVSHRHHQIGGVRAHSVSVDKRECRGLRLDFSSRRLLVYGAHRQTLQMAFERNGGAPSARGIAADDVSLPRQRYAATLRFEARGCSDRAREARVRQRDVNSFAHGLFSPERQRSAAAIGIVNRVRRQGGCNAEFAAK